MTEPGPHSPASASSPHAPGRGGGRCPHCDATSPVQPHRQGNAVPKRDCDRPAQGPKDLQNGCQRLAEGSGQMGPCEPCIGEEWRGETMGRPSGDPPRQRVPHSLKSGVVPIDLCVCVFALTAQGNKEGGGKGRWGPAQESHRLAKEGAGGGGWGLPAR